MRRVLLIKRCCSFLAKATLFILIVYGIGRFCHDKTDGFCIENIRSELSVSSEESPSSDLLQEIFEQPFSYLCKGGQCYVFLSQDGKYVLKFFKQQHARLPWFIDHLYLPPFLAKIKEEKKNRQEKEFASYKIAYEELQEETALVLLHLHKTSLLQKQVSLIDKLHIVHEIQLDDFAFLVQRRAEGVFEHLEALIAKEKMQEAKEAIHSLSLLFVKIREKKIFDMDPNISKNFGFLDSQAVQIDIGRFFKGESFDSHSYFQKKNEEFKQWLREKSPSLAQEFESECTRLSL